MSAQGYEAEDELLRERFMTAHAASPFAALPVIGENIDPPVSGAFFRFNIRPHPASLASVGSIGSTFPVLHRYGGAVIVQCLVPRGAGIEQAKQMADFALSAFRSEPEDGIRYHVGALTGYLDVVGVVDSVWYAINAVIPFERDSLY
jgi:hypothetical protein